MAVNVKIHIVKLLLTVALDAVVAVKRKGLRIGNAAGVHTAEQSDKCRSLPYRRHKAFLLDLIYS